MNGRAKLSFLPALVLPTLFGCTLLGATDATRPVGSRPSEVSAVSNEKMEFWLGQQRRGANFFNNVELRERFEAAKAVGVEVIRLAPNKWLNGRPKSELGDFLLGPKDEFHGIVPQDMRYLKTVLDQANQVGLKVVLTMLSLPAHRWSQHNEGTQERRLWQDSATWDQSIRFWKEVATELKDHPAIVGYNVLNEPSPEKVVPKFLDWHTGDYDAWYEQVRNTAADLNLFYRLVVQAIREADPYTPIVLDSGFYATPWAFDVFEPVPDDKVIYSFHMYEPFSFSSRENKGKYVYPGRSPVGEGDAPQEVEWNREALSDFLTPVRAWQRRNGIPSRRVLVGEFGAYRRNAGVAPYLDDLIAIFNEQRWHWAFYSFREDDWDGMDYELGTGRPTAKYWESVEQGRMPGPDVYRGSALFDVLKAGLTSPRL